MIATIRSDVPLPSLANGAPTRAMGSLLTTAVLLTLASAAAFLAEFISLPLPFLIGPLIFSGLMAATLSERLPDGYRFPPKLRLVFIAIIGLTIGAQVTPELFSHADRLALSAVALIVFVVAAQAIGYFVFRHIGHYDAPTAFYAAAPGGLFEAIAMGEEARGDPAKLTMQQFLRIIVVVTLLPIGLSLWIGTPVGSSAGMTLAASDVPLWSVPVTLSAGLVGFALGHLLRFPAKQLTGPMAVAAALTLSGLLSIDIPQWLINVAQVVVGTALGMRFKGLNPSILLEGIWLNLIAVGGMLLLSGLFAFALMSTMEQPFDVMLISFAPGGVTEMSLVALSLAANPALVTLHHVFRILITVVGLAISARWFRQSTPPLS
ncbi:MAG: AbrB family transcriptional regulator [Pseudomonadota bacterium]